jgi:hypothetical protein
MMSFIFTFLFTFHQPCSSLASSLGDSYLHCIFQFFFLWIKYIYKILLQQINNKFNTSYLITEGPPLSWFVSFSCWWALAPVEHLRMYHLLFYVPITIISLTMSPVWRQWGAGVGGPVCLYSWYQGWQRAPAPLFTPAVKSFTKDLYPAPHTGAWGILLNPVLPRVPSYFLILSCGSYLFLFILLDLSYHRYMFC